MAMASLQPSPIPLLPARNGFLGIRPRMAAVSCKYNQLTSVQGTRLNHISRRVTLSFMSSAALAAFLVATPAEARTSRLENKKKAMEKLEKIREKALGPKGKNGNVGKEMPPANLLVPPLVVEASL
ncbi:hypothetical protein EJB05_05931 [Eragrostis curvula]|uniref:Uncharacterized protein n=1 Tax=Eragrostis curvula TaxID=38414 RepID=A0A5J9WEU0_9POAL|nr:hypothetical protein EJB05_17714 [Eragrostis curvula]TVU46397.1 hypothetical protein EJB05_05931 [Eragrostis curvula]